MPRIDEFLTDVLNRKGSDLHFIAGDPPRLRVYGDLQALRPEPLKADFVKTGLYEIMPPQAITRFEDGEGADFAYAVTGLARFRVNVMRQLNGMGAVCRVIPSAALTLDQLNMPESVRA